VLATYRDVRCHSSAETIRAALVGNDREELVFALTQSLELYDIYQTKMLDCDRKLEVLIAALNRKRAKPIGKLLFYNTLRHGTSYKDLGANHYEQQYRIRFLANLQRRAKSLGFVLQAIPGEDANPAVS
jgi:hypothetical protein